MKGLVAVEKAGEGGLIKIANQDSALHWVWHDPKNGKLRICRPSMLETTYSAEEKEWEIVEGKARDSDSYEEIAISLGHAECSHCKKYSKLN